MITMQIPKADPASSGPWPELLIPKSKPISYESSASESYLSLEAALEEIRSCLALEDIRSLSRACRKPPWPVCKWSDEGAAVALPTNSKNVDLRFILVGGVARGRVASSAISEDVHLQPARSRSWALPCSSSGGGDASDGRAEKASEDSKTKKAPDDCFDYIFPASLNDAHFSCSDEDPEVASTANSEDIDLQQARSSSRSWGLPGSPSGVGVASDGWMEKSREETKMETEPDDVLSALNDAQSVIHKVRRIWDATESATRDEKKRLEAERDNERKLLDDTRIVLQERVTDVAALERRVDIVLGLANEKDTEIRSMRKAAKVDREKRKSEFDAVVNDMRLKREKLEKERDEVKQKARSMTKILEWERDAAIIALAEKKAENVELSKKLTSALCMKRKLEQDVIVMGNERAEGKTRDEERKKILKRSRNESSRLRVKLRATTSKKTELEAELLSMGNEKNHLENDQRTIQRKLEEEEDKLLCTICLECPKDTIVLPCLHLQFCSTCLEKHKIENQVCPACRTSIKGVLRCHL